MSFTDLIIDLYIFYTKWTKNVQKNKNKYFSFFFLGKKFILTIKLLKIDYLFLEYLFVNIFGSWSPHNVQGTPKESISRVFKSFLTFKTNEICFRKIVAR